MTLNRCEESKNNTWITVLPELGTEDCRHIIQGFAYNTSCMLFCVAVVLQPWTHSALVGRPNVDKVIALFNTVIHTMFISFGGGEKFFTLPIWHSLTNPLFYIQKRFTHYRPFRSLLKVIISSPLVHLLLQQHEQKLACDLPRQEMSLEK